MKKAFVTLYGDQLIAHKNFAHGRGQGSTLTSAICAAVREVLKHQNFRGRRVRSGKIIFEIEHVQEVREKKQSDNMAVRAPEVSAARAGQPSYGRKLA